MLKKTFQVLVHAYFSSKSQSLGKDLFKNLVLTSFCLSTGCSGAFRILSVSTLCSLVWLFSVFYNFIITSKLLVIKITLSPTGAL